MQRFFLDTGDFVGEELRSNDESLIHQLKKVLRARPGEQFIALDGSGLEYLVELIEISNTVLGKIIKKSASKNEPSLKVTLFQALPKKMDLFELVLQKGTEIGVSSFVPLITKRTEREDVSKPERLERILKEAAEQSERGKIPQLHEAISFEKYLSGGDGHDLPKYDHSILLYERSDGILLSEKISELKKAGSCALFIGPEGGFTDEEVQDAKDRNIVIASLGPRILRTETAGIIAPGLMLL